MLRRPYRRRLRARNERVHRGCRSFVASLAADFGTDAESLYSTVDRERRGIRTRDRFGKYRFVPLLCSSAALVAIPQSRTHLSRDAVVMALPAAKQRAKRSTSTIAVARLPETAVAELVDHLEAWLSKVHDGES
jgi:hypothetical protein